jgi:hypothetical protein
LRCGYLNRKVLKPEIGYSDTLNTNQSVRTGLDVVCISINGGYGGIILYPICIEPSDQLTITYHGQLIAQQIGASLDIHFIRISTQHADGSEQIGRIIFRTRRGWLPRD